MKLAPPLASLAFIAATSSASYANDVGTAPTQQTQDFFNMKPQTATITISDKLCGGINEITSLFGKPVSIAYDDRKSNDSTDQVATENDDGPPKPPILYSLYKKADGSLTLTLSYESGLTCTIFEDMQFEAIAPAGGEKKKTPDIPVLKLK